MSGKTALYTGKSTGFISPAREPLIPLPGNTRLFPASLLEMDDELNGYQRALGLIENPCLIELAGECWLLSTSGSSMFTYANMYAYIHAHTPPIQMGKKQASFSF